jgi:heat shock protein HslJ
MYWLVAFAIASGLAGCAGAGSGRALPLAGTHWILSEVKGVAVAPGAGRPPYILFDPKKKRVTGYGGVNSFFGGYETSGGELRMPRLASTRRAGPPELMQLESAFFRALTATRSYRISDDELELLDAGGRSIARFRTEKPVPSAVEK